MQAPSWPGRKDWLNLIFLVLIGCAVGVAANAVNPNGINVGIALGLGQDAAEAQP